MRRVALAAGVTGLIATTVWAVVPSGRQVDNQALSVTGAAAPAPRQTEAEAVTAAKASGKRVEVLSQRGESKQVFANPDGTFTGYTFQQPTQMVQDGRWVPTDSTMVAHADGTVGPQAVLTNLRLSGGGDGLFASVERAGRRYALSWPAPLPKPVLSGSTATYPNALPDVDLVVQASVTGFTHVLVVKTREAARLPQVRQVRFGLRLQLLKVQATSNGGLRMTDAGSGGVVFDTPPARMWDSSAVNAKDVTMGAPEGATVARVGITVADGNLTLQPDLALLDGPETRYPVYIDPFTASTNNESWAMVDSGYPSEEYWKFDGKSDERVGMCPWQTTSDCGSNSRIKRLYYVLGTSYAGKTILSASFGITQTHTYNSTAYPVSLYRANSGGALISTATNWSNRPTSVTLQQTISPTGETSCQSGTTRNVWFSATESVQKAVASGWTKTTYLIRAVNEGDNDYVQLKRYCANAVLSVTYNRAPNQPASSGLSMNPGGACVSGSSRPYVSSLPQLKAVLSDPDTADAEPLTAEFQVNWTPVGGTLQTKTWKSSQLANGSTFTYNLADTTSGVPNLPENIVVQWKVRAHDGTTNGPWSSDNGKYLCEFILDKTKPTGPDIDSPEYLPGDAGDTTPNCLDDDPTWFPGVGRYGTFTFDSAATDVSEYWYAFDGSPSALGKLTPSVDGGPVTVKWQPLSDGPHTINVLAVDRAGKQSDTASCTFRVAAGSGPVAEWRLDDAAGSATAADATGSFPATAGSATQFGVPGPGGPADKAVHLNGTSSSTLFTTATKLVDTGKDFSASVWVRLNDLTKYQTILSQDGSGEPGFQVGFTPNGTKWYVTAANNDVQSLGSWSAYGPVAEKDKWTHLAVTFDATAQKITLYVNGVSAASANWRVAWTSHGAVQIGRRFSRTGVYSETVVGDLADVHLYDRALVPTEISVLPTLLTSRLAYWDVDAVTPVENQAPLIGKSAGYGPTVELEPALELSLYTGARHYRRLSPDEPGYDPFAPAPLVGDGHLVLDGATGYAATAGPVAITDSSFSIAARVQLATDCTTGAMTVLSQPGTYASGFDLRCAPDGAGGAKWQIVLPGSDADSPTASTTVSGDILRPDPTASAGQFLTVTYDAAYQTVQLFVDGQLLATATDVPNPWNATAGGLQVGRSKVASTWGSYFAGVVDEVRVYSGALDATTVQQLNILTAVPEL